MAEEKDIVDDIKLHLNFIRSGSCKRCGKCCYVWVGKENIGIERSACDHLEFDGEGLAVCNLGEDKLEGCKAYPMRPHALGYDSEYFKDCGYSFTLRTDLTKEQMIANMDYVCSLCFSTGEQIYCSKRTSMEDIIDASFTQLNT